ncbi:MAG: ComF family protein [Gemmatimonadales bacterium]
MRWVDLADRGVAALERWWLPGECLLCLRAVPAREQDALVCAACRRSWSPVAPPWCRRCGETLDAPWDRDPVTEEGGCHLCVGWPPGLDSVRSAVWLAGSAREAVHLLKYEGWWRVAEVMAAAMRDLETLAPGVVLAPMPLGRRRERERGFNQAERLASALGRVARLRMCPGLLERTRETATQTRLTPEARRANVHGAFRGHRGAVGARVVLVDDVFTTGATLQAAAAALHAAGAARVDAVTFARGTGPLPRT